MGKFTFRETLPSEKTDVILLYDKAREFMKNHGNPSQWTTGAPNLNSLEKDMANHSSFVVLDGGKVVGTFALYHLDGNYASIAGKWLNEEPYAVIHRIASDEKGVGTFVLQEVCARNKNVRIDTHKDNFPMQHLLQKMGFVHCGTILLLDKDNSPREAYMKVHSL
jgi:RimJ/RimL family protein N-acetyltransferase